MKELRDIYRSPNFKSGAYQVGSTGNLQILHKNGRLGKGSDSTGSFFRIFGLRAQDVREL